MVVVMAASYHVTVTQLTAVPEGCCSMGLASCKVFFQADAAKRLPCTFEFVDDLEMCILVPLMNESIRLRISGDHWPGARTLTKGAP